MNRKALIYSGIAKLANSNRSILGIVSCGSFSRDDMDQYSDIDLYIFTNSVSDFSDENNNDWLDALGERMYIRIFNNIEEGVYKIKLIIVGGLMFDLTIVSGRKFSLIGLYLKLINMGLNGIIPKRVSRLMESNINTFYETIRRGYEIHLDKIGIGKILNKAVKYTEKKNKSTFSLTKKQFENSYNFFWQSCYTASIKLIRGDYFYVILVYDHYLKRELIKMIEWGECIAQGDHLDFFYNAYKIKSWGGIRLYDSLKGTLLANDLIEMQRSLLYMIEIYQEYSRRVSENFKFSRNIKFEQFVIDFIKEAMLNTHEK
ncbi:aminoglycoside 6-adenylyltransferase [Sphingobacterium sp. DR205]|uniref:aminoglycoside 6-adenylyltransferase n=1 Tax=Sphingobacterium sp. DR205 TaxID=2713573 RepID=UPI0013E4A0C1|nr:aminoglycoside 6-adenylyltransferase [Sphingobacterium sp. DR205]QIH33426.1 aminoglycoside 6-adenylyltransferase [Sphingobacterium sp. DR205]